MLGPYQSGPFAIHPMLFLFYQTMIRGLSIQCVLLFCYIGWRLRKIRLKFMRPTCLERAVITSTPLGQMASLTFVSSLKNIPLTKEETKSKRRDKQDLSLSTDE